MNLTTSKMWICMLMIGAASLLTSCKDDDDDRDYTMGNQEFVTLAASSNMFEVAAGSLAVTKAENAEVKAYGEHMVADHSAATVELKNLAGQKGWSVPETLLPKEQANLVKLNALSGNAFDREFANIMVQSHQEAVALFEMGAANLGVPDGDLRGMAAAKLPTLRVHLQEATELRAQVNP